MAKNKDKVRCNMFLDKHNVGLIKDFIKGTGLTFSSFIELLVQKTSEDIDNYNSLIGSEIPEDIIFTEEDGKRYFNIYEAHKMLGLADTDSLGFRTSPSQKKKIETGKWKYDFDQKKGLRLIIGKIKNK